MNIDLGSVHVQDYMSRDLVAVRAGESVRSALQLMVQDHVATVPVVDHQDHCLGVLSATDLMNYVFDLEEELAELEEREVGSTELLAGQLAQSQAREPIDSLMSEKVVTADHDTTLLAAAQTMLKHGIHHLPVVDKNKRLIGIIGMSDILRAAVSDASE